MKRQIDITKRAKRFNEIGLRVLLKDKNLTKTMIRNLSVFSLELAKSEESENSQFLDQQEQLINKEASWYLNKISCKKVNK